MALASLAASFASFSWGLALGFSLAVVVMVSLVLLLAYPKTELELEASSSRSRAFKGEQVVTSVRLGSRRRLPLAMLELLSFPEGLEVTVGGEGDAKVLEARSAFAGVYSGVTLMVGILDPLGIFSRKEVHELKVTYEFLPTFLLARREALRLAATILGDYPAGRSGFGQEFYSAEVYSTSSNSKDIMWKRQAKMPNESLMVRVGEANIPEQLSLCFVERKELDPRKRARWMDLASEAIARVGLPVISSGITLKMVHVRSDGTAVSEARDAGELASLVMGIWEDGKAGNSAADEPARADMVITAEEETQSPETMKLVLDKPSIILRWGKSRRDVLGTDVIFFTGTEDVSNLVARVLSR